MTCKGSATTTYFERIDEGVLIAGCAVCDREWPASELVDGALPEHGPLVSAEWPYRTIKQPPKSVRVERTTEPEVFDLDVLDIESLRDG